MLLYKKINAQNLSRMPKELNIFGGSAPQTPGGSCPGPMPLSVPPLWTMRPVLSLTSLEGEAIQRII